MEGSSSTYKHAAELGADLRGQANSLGFASGKRGGGSGQAQIIQTDGGEKIQPIADLFHDASRDLMLALVEFPCLDGSETRDRWTLR